MAIRRQLAAILFTDIVDYTAIMQRDEQEAVNIVQRHKEVLEKHVKNHGGSVHQYYGDGSMSTFSSTNGAVLCAIEMQQIFQQDPRLPLRIGIHIGEIRFEGNKVLGDGVNIASRLEGLGVAGSVIISEKVKIEIENQTHIKTQFVGVFQLKNVEKPVKVFALEAMDLTVPSLKLMQGKAKLLSPKGRFKKRSMVIPALTILGGVVIIIFVMGIYFNFWRSGGTATEPYKITPLTSSIWFEGFPSWSPDGSMFTYVSLVSGNTDIYIKNRSGGDAIQIVDSPYDEYNPRWSPDGSKIAYISAREDGTNIYYVPSTGGLERKLARTNLPGLEQAFFGLGTAPWSPDGNELLFSKMDEKGNIVIHKVNLLDDEIFQVTNPPSGNIDLSASWSSDGKSIVFQRNGKLWIISNGNKQERLLLPDLTIITPVFSRDSKKIVFSALLEAGINIWELELASNSRRQLTYSTKWMLDPAVIPNGGLSIDQFSHQIDLIQLNTENMEEERLTFNNGDNYYGRFSQDGKKIVYQSNQTGNYEIWMIDLERGNNEINLSGNQAFDFRPDWSPIGDKIAFFSDWDNVFKVWIMDSDGKNLQKASEEPVDFETVPMDYIHQLKWSPDGKKIAYLALSEYGNSVWIVDPESRSARPYIFDVNSFSWYQNSSMIICNRIATARANTRDLVAVNLETGRDKILRPGVSLTELFVSTDGQWLGYTSAVGHFSYNIFRLRLEPPGNLGGFPLVVGEPDQLTDGAGKWHVHNGSFSSDGKSILYSRDADQMDIFIMENYR